MEDPGSDSCTDHNTVSLSCEVVRTSSSVGRPRLYIGSRCWCNYISLSCVRSGDQFHLCSYPKDIRRFVFCFLFVEWWVSVGSDPGVIRQGGTDYMSVIPDWFVRDCRCDG